MTPEDEKFERIAQRHIADLKKSSKAIVEDAAVRAAHKVMAEFAQGAHTEAKVEYHTTMIQCPHCDGSVRVQAQPYPDNFIDALKYDVAKRDSEAQQQEPVAWADDCRIELVTAIHFITSDYENALGAFGEDIEARRKAEGDIAHARKIAAKWNWNGRTTPPASKPLTDEEIAKIAEKYTEPLLFRVKDFARAIEAAHGIKE